MCSYDYDGELPEAYREVMRKARKRHCCEECGCGISPGEQYQYASGVWGGEPESHKTCADCVRTIAAWSDVSWTVCRERATYEFGGAGMAFAEFVSEHVKMISALASHVGAP